MTARFVACPKCRKPVPPPLYNSVALERCPACAARLQIEVFPAALRPPHTGAKAEAVLVEGEASCFYHPAKKAVVPCGSCGRFLCPVCDVELNGDHLCPACLESGKKKGRLHQIENRRTLYDSLALTVAVYPLVLVWTSIVGAPIALYIALRYWNAPSSVVPRSKWRAVAAIVISLCTILGWIGLFYTLSQRNSG